MEGYRTLAGRGESLLIEKKSKFIGHASPASSKEAALDFIGAIRAEYRDASHNVPAYYIRAGNLTHAGDDGEPSGTAGMPVLGVLQKGGIVDAVVVVTRYFGGTKLGTGGLVHAYSAAALDAVQDAGIAEMTLSAVYSLTVDYALYELLEKLLASLSVRVDGADFADRVTLRCAVRL